MTSVRFLNVPFESNYKDTVWFPNNVDGKLAQVAYMKNHQVAVINDVSYQRKDNIIRVPAHIDTLYNCNYVAYDNQITAKKLNGTTSTINKTFYAFITDMKYVNDERTDVYIETDVIQTWMFDYEVKPSFVEREHVEDDDFRENTVPELLESGPYICSGEYVPDVMRNLSVIVGVTKTTIGENVSGSQYNGIYSGIKYYGMPGYDIVAITEFIKGYDENGHGEAIQNMFIAPNELTSYDGENAGENPGSISGAIRETKDVWSHSISSSEIPDQVNLFDGYIPRNNKLLSFPYRYLYVNNNNGGEAIYKYEDFAPENGYDLIKFEIIGSLTPGCSIRLIPRLYKGVSENYAEGLNLGKFPICNWTSDVYTNWLTQNSINIATDFASGGIQLAKGVVDMVASKGTKGVDDIVNGGLSIMGTVGQIYQHSFTPPQSKGNLNCGDVATSDGKNNFYFYEMCIKKEYAQIIDEFFDMFGYKVNRVKVPLKDHRTHYWFTKTIDVNIDGAIPNKDLEKIKQCYNNGITFWRANSEMGVYYGENWTNETM